MMAFIKKEKDSSKILAFINNEDINTICEGEQGGNMAALRDIKAEVAKRNNLPLESVSMRYIKEERRIKQ